MKLSQYLYNAFQQSGMTREEFAKFIGVSRPTLNNYMSGETCPDFCEACEIVKKTGKEVAIIEKVCEDGE